MGMIALLPFRFKLTWIVLAGIVVFLCIKIFVTGSDASEFLHKAVYNDAARKISKTIHDIPEAGSVAIMNLRGQNGKTVSDMLRDIVRKGGKISVIEPGLIDKVLKSEAPACREASSLKQALCIADHVGAGMVDRPL